MLFGSTHGSRFFNLVPGPNSLTSFRAEYNDQLVAGLHRSQGIVESFHRPSLGRCCPTAVLAYDITSCLRTIGGRHQDFHYPAHSWARTVSFLYHSFRAVSIHLPVSERSAREVRAEVVLSRRRTRCRVGSIHTLYPRLTGNPWVNVTVWVADPCVFRRPSLEVGWTRNVKVLGQSGRT